MKHKLVATDYGKYPIMDTSENDLTDKNIRKSLSEIKISSKKTEFSRLKKRNQILAASETQGDDSSAMHNDTVED